MSIMQGRTGTLVYLVCLLAADGAALANLTCDCGLVNKGRNFGGQPASKYKYPMMARLEDSSGMMFCGGTIITPWHVLTIVECIRKSEFKLRVGGSYSGMVLPVRNVIKHTEYDMHNGKHNIAILVTPVKIKFNNLLSPACLPNRKLRLVGQRVIALGCFPLIDGISTTTFREVTLSVQDHNVCRSSSKYFQETSLCTYGENIPIIKGDEGGPVMWLDPETNRYTLVGVMRPPENTFVAARINLDVSAYIDWIIQALAITDPSAVVCTKV